MSAKTILYVEDNELNRKMLRHLLRSTSYRLIEAPDGEAGMAMAVEQRPDLILTGHAALTRPRWARDYTSFTFLSGRLRTGLPVAAKMPLSTAGVTTEIVGSPTPPQKSCDGTITVSTLGISARRRIG